MDSPADKSVEERRKFVEAWNSTMIDIWQERINKLKVIDTGSLWRSPVSLPVLADGRFFDISLSQTFLEYGIWQDLGTGRNVAIGNTHKKDMDDWENKRERRRWFSTAYYSSTMKLRDVMADSLGKEFVGLFANLDADDYRKYSNYYRDKGLS